MTARHASLLRNLARAHGWETLECEGVVPDDLVGTLVRVGPGLFERFGVGVRHPFEADGVVSGVRIDDHGQASGAVRVIESEGYRAEEAAGRRLYGAAGVPWLRQVRNNFSQRSKNSANTSAWAWNGRLFALMEGGKPTELDAETLTTLGEREFDGVVTRTFSAHPHRVATLATSFNFGVRFGRTTSLDLFALPDRGPARRIASVELPWATLVHDFVATETHLVFVVCPAQLQLWRAILGIGGFSKLFEWRPTLGCELIIVPLADPERVERIACDPFWVWHFANGYRRGNELVWELCRYPDFSTLDAIAGEGQVSAPPRYHRAIVELGSGRVRSEALIEGGAEFPKVHPRVEGGEHRYAWIRRGMPPGEGIARLEVETGALRLWAPPPELGISEPIVVPRSRSSSDVGEDEADVWVLVLCHDDKRDRSCLAILDGRDPESGPVAKLWFDQTIPMTFHGTWLPAPVLA